MEQKKSIFSPTKAWKYLFKKPVTIDKHDVFVNPREASDRYRGFHTNDWDKCIGCGTCSEICPTEAINMIEVLTLEDKQGAKKERPAFDYGRCSFCALCVDICTSDSLGMSKEYIHLSTEPDSFFFLPENDGIHQIKFDDGYDRDEVSELLDLERYEMVHEGVERKDSFIEIVKGFSKEMAINEAARCVGCGVCTATCPAHMHIPEYIERIYADDLKGSISEIYKTNPLPGVCGSICTHKCEGVCSIGQRGDPIAIRWLKRFAVDNAPMDQYEQAVLEKVTGDSDGKIGIVGGGPAGIGAAYFLRTLGYEVHLYEEMPLIGGVARYGAPIYRLPEERLDKDTKMLEVIGVNIHTNMRVGRDITIDEMHEKFDVVFLGSGYTLSRPLKIPNWENPEVRYAMKLLQETRDYQRGVGEMPEITENMVVIGGGNVAFDVARTLVRLQNEKFGKSNVSMAALEERAKLPADLEEIEEGEEEGIHFNFGYGPQEIVLNEDGTIKGLVTKKVEYIFDSEGRFNPKYDDNDVRLLEGSQVYVAIGQMPDYTYFNDDMEKSITVERGKLKILPTGQVEGLPWLFAGGDIVRGPDIINGVATGYEAAKGIDDYLQNLKK